MNTHPFIINKVKDVHFKITWIFLWAFIFEFVVVVVGQGCHIRRADIEVCLVLSVSSLLSMYELGFYYFRLEEVLEL